MSPFEIRPLGADRAVDIAAIHAASFETSWSADDLKTHIEQDLTLGIWQEEDITKSVLAGFVVLRCIDDQAEILTIAIAPPYRARGLARHLLGKAEEAARASGVEIIFLEVAEDNAFAIRLYKNAGYVPIGRRPAYYRRASGRIGAINFSKTLTKRA